MKRGTTALALISLLLFLAAAGFAGCGNSNPLASITITPEVPVVAKGKTLQLEATAHFSGGMIVTSWTQVMWRSSNPAVATVSSTGLVSAVETGEALITATDIGHPSITCSVTVSVTELTSITVAPANAVISAGTATQFTATGFYSSGTPTAWSPTWPPDLTTLVSWASSSTDVALFSDPTGAPGLVTAGTTTGTTTISATDLATGITGTVILTVVP